MAKKPTATDAQLILQLYDLRREPEMRKARNWWAADFFPENADDFVKVAWAMGSQENNWLRQVSGYWGMAASFVLQGVLNEELFLHPDSAAKCFSSTPSFIPSSRNCARRRATRTSFSTLRKSSPKQNGGATGCSSC